MGRTLFDMTAEMEQLYAMATEEELYTEQIFQDTIEALMGEIEVKGAGYVANDCLCAEACRIPEPHPQE